MITFSVITPVRNSDTLLVETLASVSSQIGLGKKFKIQHVIVDGASTDKTLQIAKNYSLLNTSDWISYEIVSEEDAGMYDAISKGLSKCTGEIISYQNAGDFYHVGAFSAIEFAYSNSNFSWFYGRKVTYNYDGTCIKDSIPVMYHQNLINTGYHGMFTPNLGFFQQESLFFVKSELEHFGIQVFKKFRLAGDFFLLKYLINRSEGLLIDGLLSGHRIHKNQLSEDKTGYFIEMSTLTDKPKFSTKLFAFFIKFLSRLPQPLIRKTHRNIMYWDFKTQAWVIRSR